MLEILRPSIIILKHDFEMSSSRRYMEFNEVKRDQILLKSREIAGWRDCGMAGWRDCGIAGFRDFGIAGLEQQYIVYTFLFYYNINISLPFQNESGRNSSI